MTRGRTPPTLGPLTCQEMAVLFGMDVVPARVRPGQAAVPLAPVDQPAAVDAAAVRSDDGVRLDGRWVDHPGCRLHTTRVERRTLPNGPGPAARQSMTGREVADGTVAPDSSRASV
ncbi:hypothetical protein E1283_08525 [Streptomyces hainanensis]|uniref:Uncharacterized protein n=1 Tax=Streptomyces hainanensis TaxID=402648 RepID=A0A4R4THA8_9ACTN|nr:hypothetical protein E1283_08525 [Streptomyces hainanensis]